MNKRKIGSIFEERACEFLKEQNFKIIERNFQNRIGEIDIIAKEGECLCFIEVKERSTFKCGIGLEAVDKRKQKNIIKVAKFYLYLKHINLYKDMRFDVVSFDNNNITLIRNAFREE